MLVSVFNTTSIPLTYIGDNAGVSTGRMGNNADRARRCIKAGHLGMLEFVDVTLHIAGISRACSHQLVRYREATFNQESQRHVKVDVDTIWYVTPPSIEDDIAYRVLMDECGSLYKNLLEQGVRPEDARFVLPNATKTQLRMKMNCRELAHFLKQRMAPDAQWEIRELGEKICEELRKQSEEWNELVDLMLEYGV